MMQGQGATGMMQGQGAGATVV